MPIRESEGDVANEGLGDRTRRTLLRILDANRNRALEALRVVEEHARFVLSADALARRVKELRHRLHLALPQRDLPLARDVETDVLSPERGGGVAGDPAPVERRTAEDVALANLSRAKEAVRALEEYAKPISGESAAELERIRYAVYAIEKEIVTADRARGRLEGRHVYVIVEPRPSRPPILDQARAALAGGARLFQLRDKTSSDRERLAQARALADLCHANDALLIVNDRPDLAALAGTDGVHVGQDDLAPKDARALLAPEALIGSSAHDEPELARSLASGVDYMGVGTVFASATKPDLTVRGLEVVRKLVPLCPVPIYGIGGIDATNAESVIEAGAFGVAVSSAVLDAKDIARATARLVELVGAALERRAP
jgi:thiamine-phosphate pyrophosphorylase